MIVSKRLPGELTDLREFIRPHDVMVRRLVSGRRSPRAAWAWVLANIAYPPGPITSEDEHVWFDYPDAEGRYTEQGRSEDWWNFPAETLAQRTGDCEDSSFLLTSILRCANPNFPAYATIGYWGELGHVWCSVFENGEWYVLDTTLNRQPAQPPLEAAPYRPLLRVNDAEVIEVRSPAAIPPNIRRFRRAKRDAINAWYESAL